MYTNLKHFGRKFGPEIKQQIKDADHIEIATGYFGYHELQELSQEILKAAERGSCKLLFGMIYHDRASPAQKECLIELHKKLKSKNSDSGIFITKQTYHGKVYRFKTRQKETVFVGSSNFSWSGLGGWMEFNLEIVDVKEKKSVIEFLNYLFVGDGIKTGISSSLDDVELKLKNDNDVNRVRGDKNDIKQLKDYEIKEDDFPKFEDTGFFSIRHRPSLQPNSSLNLYFDKGRKTIKNGREIYEPRPWYEIEITSQVKEQKHKDYPPKGSWVAYTRDPEENKFYKLHMTSASGQKYPKALMTSKIGGGRGILGELIKGRMERKGVLRKYERISEETLTEYGTNCIQLKKIDSKTYIMKV